MSAPLIAIVDDNQAIVELIVEILTDEGYRTTPITSARDAAVKLFHDSPSLAIIDINLERALAGWELVQQIRADSTVQHIPLIISSADMRFLDEKAQDIAKYKLDVLNKPFHIDVLTSMVARLIGPDHTS